MARGLVVLRGRAYVVEFEHEPATGDGVHEEYIPESYIIYGTFRCVSFSAVGNVDLTEQFTKAEVVEAIKRVGSDL